ncbi:MAG: sulfoxide reductase heme-binding subunit YedZ [Nitrospinota bacterium]|nr:MAG: sulfoxide reductase heme-binding subunit YedZ [Nitrospinota bacterium]
MQATKAGIFLLCLLPFVLLVWDTFTGNLGANPVETITRRTGIWGLRFLLITLSVTPLRRLSGWNRLIRFRRMFGLFAFFYASLHFLTYLVFDQFFSLAGIWDDIAKRPYITAGFTGYVLLFPLAVTSTRRLIKWLGGKRWQQLHRLVYVIAIIGVVHFFWLVKADIRRPFNYALLLGLLLAYRIGAKYLGAGLKSRQKSLLR